MGWLSIVLWVLRYAPDVIGLIQQIIALLHTLPKDQQAAALKELVRAKQTSNPAEVKAVAEKWHRKCAFGGVGCGGDLLDSGVTPPGPAPEPVQEPEGEPQ